MERFLDISLVLSQDFLNIAVKLILITLQGCSTSMPRNVSIRPQPVISKSFLQSSRNSSQNLSQVGRTCIISSTNNQWMIKTPARETAPELSDDEVASLITPDLEGGTADNNRGPLPSLTLETLSSTGLA